MELGHFSHKHPLILNEELKNDGKIYLCFGCLKIFSGSNYSCKECYFELHKSCAELPRNLQHPLHPKHPLILHMREWQPTKCDGCNIGYAQGLTYHCSHCEFNLEPKCATLPLTKETEIHDHPLTLVRKSFSFTCDTCGKEGKGMFYLCPTCSFVVHPECSSLPLIVKVIRHKHPLNLTYSLQVNQPTSRFCQLCVGTVDTNYGVYYCSSCDFLAHPDCVTNKEDRDETFMREFKDTEPIVSTRMLEYEDPGLHESIDSLPYVVKKIKMGVEETEVAVEIRHFSHEHDLILTEELDINEKCDGCMRPIYPPFYSCAQCRFFLHNFCAKLPRKRRHFLHPHPLTLLSEAPNVSGCFLCDACECLCNGFTYTCDKCMFYLDVQCSSISDTFTHDGHEHQLIFSNLSYGTCCCCDSSTRSFRCADCEFILDFNCATLPRTVRYEPFEHPFTLCYTVEDDSGEYYCDICEEQRDPTKWFYYCADLYFPAHPECILGEFPYIKFRRTSISETHEHSLTIVQKTKDHPSCNICGYLCDKLTFECAKCNFNIHMGCLERESMTELAFTTKFQLKLED